MSVALTAESWKVGARLSLFEVCTFRAMKTSFVYIVGVNDSGRLGASFNWR